MTEHTSSYYAASANKYAPFDTLNESISCDVCVVGGGYTGLSSTHLAEAGFDVVVLEASRIGFGASGRNGGQLCELLQPRHRRDRKKLRHGHRPYARQHDVQEGGGIIRERIKRYQIDSSSAPAACLWR
ncbi:NAD(P)/FAD-dependent oxidoreductase [Escherichia coli]